MIRKMLLVASAIAMPLGATAVTAITGPTIAGAVSVPIVCHPTAPLGVVTWAPPGLTLNGTVSASPTSTTTTTAQTIHCTGGVTGNGGSPAKNIVTNSTMCTGTNAPLPGCALGMFDHGSIAGLSGNSGNLWMSLPTISWTIGTQSYTMTSNSSNVAAGCVAANEIGFTVHGTITAGPATRLGHVAKYVACFSTDTGPGTSGSMTTDLANQTFAGTILTSTLSVNSKIRVA